jgi:hypothetical protein
MGLSSSTTGGGSLKLISTFTSDGSDDTASFTSGIDSTYKEYLFVFSDIHSQNDGAQFQVGFRDGSTAYDASKISTYYDAEHNESGSGGGVAYDTGGDLALSTSFQNLTQDCGNDNDQSICGFLSLLNPSSTTFVKCFYATTNSYTSDNRNMNAFIDGYSNVTAAIDGVQFKFSGGQIQGGTIKMYGVA